MSRHIARETALKMLFQMDVGKNSIETAQATLEEVNLTGPLKEFASQLAEGAFRCIPELDGRLSPFISDWEIDRLANVDKNILRMALFELLHPESVPATVIIDEAVELAKTFGGEDSGAFVNAVLDSFRKSLG